ncbi:MAG: DUF3089 domain-containing protein [Flavobacteriales bacterium]|nr:DUF3089 domain-containing protein [Flavobacteriales bacterium]
MKRLRSIGSFIVLLIVISFDGYAQRTTFEEENHPTAPNYSEGANWSALPFREDNADVLPKYEMWVSDSLKEVDVFYVHPTMYQRGPLWNASLEMKKINRRVDKYPVRLQASVFNASCRVYAPRYRQAVVRVFYEHTEDGEKALDLAYSDVKRAFEYYLEHYNNGRPFIIAGHSQGTHHTRRLLQEMIDTTELRNRMVAAYVIGFTLNESMYKNLKFCSNADETGCIISWMSYREGFTPEGDWYKTMESVNPLSWTLDTALVVREDHAGTVVLNPKHTKPRRMEARVADIGGKVLWVKTEAPWFRSWKNLHLADYGLFYMDIRKNVKDRIDSFMKKN